MTPGSTPSANSGRATTTFELLQRARGGDRAALDGLFARLLPSLRRWAHGRLRRGARDGGADTADLVQQAMVGALRHLDHFEPKRRDALRAYLRKAIRNRVVDEERRTGRRPRQVTLDQADLAAEPGLSPLGRLLSREQEERLQQAIEKLGIDDRELVIARLDLGYSYAQIALACGRPTADAARMAVHRALLRLAEEMGAD
jgi:RNA polymerase sigma-70 factor (ECF subfamily)